VGNGVAAAFCTSTGGWLGSANVHTRGSQMRKRAVARPDGGSSLGQGLWLARRTRGLKPEFLLRGTAAPLRQVACAPSEMPVPCMALEGDNKGSKAVGAEADRTDRLLRHRPKRAQVQPGKTHSVCAAVLVSKPPIHHMTIEIDRDPFELDFCTPRLDGEPPYTFPFPDTNHFNPVLALGLVYNKRWMEQESVSSVAAAQCCSGWPRKLEQRCVSRKRSS
jgi:hypothetical protein